MTTFTIITIGNFKYRYPTNTLSLDPINAHLLLPFSLGNVTLNVLLNLTKPQVLFPTAALARGTVYLDKLPKCFVIQNFVENRH